MSTWRMKQAVENRPGMKNDSHKAGEIDACTMKVNHV